MRAMTKEFLEAAFAGESQAHVKYLVFAEEAERKGMPKLANLFKAISHAEYVHAKNHLKALGKVGEMVDNIQSAEDGEHFEIEEMYPVYFETAKFQDEKEAQRSTHYALEAEKIHEKMYENAKTLVKNGQDYPSGKILICPVCGHTVEEHAPDKCPVCNVPGDKFILFQV